MTKGQVKWFDPKKGYGFIVGPENQDVFVHYSHIESDGFRSLKDGEEVEYELIEGDKGWQARNVKATGVGVPEGSSHGGGGGGGRSSGGGGGKGRPRSGGGGRGGSSADMLVDRPRGAAPADNPPRDTPSGGGYESGPVSTGYEGYESAGEEGGSDDGGDEEKSDD